METKTAIWDQLKRVPADQLKGFNRAGGFKGTAIKPMWTIHRMTEVFGACGEGWGMNEPTFQVIPAGNETLVFCTVGVWTAQGARRSSPVYGVGGDKVLTMGSNGAFIDDEAFKKAYTDALTNALKHIGAGADVHMGLWDGNKYVDEGKEPAPVNDTRSSASLKRDGEWERVRDEIASDLTDCHTHKAIDDCMTIWRDKFIEMKWPKAWSNAAKDLFEDARATIKDIQYLQAGE